MKIAYICADPGIPVFGRKRGRVQVKGCTIHVREMIRSFQRLGACVSLFAACAEGDPPADVEGVAVHRMPEIAAADPAERERFALAANDSLRDALERNGPFDLVYERYSLWSYAGMSYARGTHTPGLLEINAPLIDEQIAHRVLVDRPAAEAVLDRVRNEATALLAVSNEVASYLNGLPGPGAPVVVVPNGVDPERFRPGLPAALPSAPGGFTIGFVGALKPWHGLPRLIDAFALLSRLAPEARLLIVGDGPEAERVARALGEHGVRDRAHCTGAVQPGQVPGYLASMDVAVAPYPMAEQFYFSPLKVYEYMAAGLPVIASRIGQLDGLITHGVNGWLCDADDPLALATAFETLRKQPLLRQQLGRAARDTILRGHTWESAALRALAAARFESSARIRDGVCQGIAT